MVEEVQVPVNPFAVAATLNNEAEEEGEEQKQGGEAKTGEVANAMDQLPASDPVWLGDLIRDGFYDKLVLIGFPYDEGARKAQNRKGADFGPGK